jgi:hypothetical protein
MLTLVFRCMTGTWMTKHKIRPQIGKFTYEKWYNQMLRILMTRSNNNKRLNISANLKNVHKYKYIIPIRLSFSFSGHISYQLYYFVLEYANTFLIRFTNITVYSYWPLVIITNKL